MADELAMVGSLQDVLKLSDTLSKAIGTGFIPKAYRNSAEIAAVILAGRELGVPPMASLRNFFLIDGKLGMDASFVLGRMKAAGVTHEWTCDTNDRATLVLERPGHKPYTSTFSMDDARAAGLAHKDVWKKYPRSMLRARAVTAGARAYAPDVFSGAAYTAEELRAGDVDPADPARVVVEATPTDVVETAGEVVDGAVKRLTASVNILEIAQAFDAAQTREEVKAIYTSLRPAWESLTVDQRKSLKAHRDESLERVEREIKALAQAMRDDDGGYVAGDAPAEDEAAQ